MVLRHSIENRSIGLVLVSQHSIGILQVAFCLCVKMNLCKTIPMKMCSIHRFFFMQIKLIFLWKFLYKVLFWNRGTRYLGNGPLKTALTKLKVYLLIIFISVFCFTCSSYKSGIQLVKRDFVKAWWFIIIGMWVL